MKVIALIVMAIFGAAVGFGISIKLEDRLTFMGAREVTGTIVNTFKAADGDLHINMRVDSKYQGLVRKGNRKGLLVVEDVCHFPSPKYCRRQSLLADYNFTPGRHYRIVGWYAVDHSHRDQAELHGIISIQEIKAPSLAG